MGILRLIGVCCIVATLAAVGVAAAAPVDDANAGLQALNQGDAAGAVRLFTQAIASGRLSDDDLEYAYVERGKAYLQLGEYRSATADLRRAARMRPDDAEAASALRLALSGRGGGPRTHPGEPAAPPPYGQAEAAADATAGLQALGAGDAAHAVALFSRAITSGKLPPEDLELAYLSRAKAALQAGDARQAVADADEALKLKSDDTEAGPLLAQALLQLRAPAPLAPIDAATCGSNFASKGNFFSGKTSTIWGVYPTLSPTDAFAGLYVYLNNPANGPSDPWAIGSANLDQGAISASSAIQGTPLSSTLDVRVEAVGAGSKVSISFAVPGLIMSSNTREYLCTMLGAAASG